MSDAEGSSQRAAGDQAAAFATGFHGLIGMMVAERTAGASKTRIVATPAHLNPAGVCHGGVVYSMADTGMGVALSLLLDAGERCTTIDIKMVYISPAREGEIDCESRVIHKGRTTAVIESDVYQEGRRVAKALGTYAILAPRGS